MLKIRSISLLFMIYSSSLIFWSSVIESQINFENSDKPVANHIYLIFALSTVIICLINSKLSDSALPEKKSGFILIITALTLISLWLSPNFYLFVALLIIGLRLFSNLIPINFIYQLVICLSPIFFAHILLYLLFNLLNANPSSLSKFISVISSLPFLFKNNIFHTFDGKIILPTGKIITIDLLKTGFYLFMIYVTSLFSIIISAKLPVKTLLKLLGLLLTLSLIHFSISSNNFIENLIYLSPESFIYKILSGNNINLLILTLILLFLSPLLDNLNFTEVRTGEKKFILQFIGICFLITAFTLSDFYQNKEREIIIDLIHSPQLLPKKGEIPDSKKEKHFYDNFIKNLSEREKITFILDRNDYDLPARKKISLEYKINNEQLKNPSKKILLLLSPEKFFTEEEITIIQNFVMNGGNLLISANGKNITGTTYLNSICEKAGIVFNNDIVDYLPGTSRKVKKPEIKNPSLKNGISEFEFNDLSSLTLEKTAKAAMVSPLFSFTLDNSSLKSSTISKVKNKIRIGGAVIVAEASLGSGQILAFTFPDLLNNYNFFNPKAQIFTNNLFDFLMRENFKNKTIFFRILFFLLSIILLFFSFSRCSNRELFLKKIIFLLPFAIFSMDKLNTDISSNKLKKESSFEFLKSSRLLFDLSKTYTTGKLQNNSNNFFNYQQSLYALLKTDPFLGFIDSGEKLSEEQVTGIKILCLVEPKNEFTSKELSDIEEFVDNGGNLILLGDSEGLEIIKKVSEIFGIKILSTVYLSKRQELSQEKQDLFGENGTPVITLNGRSPVLYKQFNKGHVLFIGFKNFFAGSRFSSETVKNEFIQKLFFEILNNNYEGLSRLDWNKIIK